MAVQLGTGSDTKTSAEVKLIRAGQLPVISSRLTSSISNLELFQKELESLYRKFGLLEPKRKLRWKFESGTILAFYMAESGQ